MFAQTNDLYLRVKLASQQEAKWWVGDNENFETGQSINIRKREEGIQICPTGLDVVVSSVLVRSFLHGHAETYEVGESERAWGHLIRLRIALCSGILYLTPN